MRQPVPSRRYEVRVGAKFDLKVYGLLLQPNFYYFCEVKILHQALYRKWRPQTFDDVCGQDHITSVLKYEIANAKSSHAYLFCGSRGTGKTTCAKILAKAVNCENPINGNPCNECASCRSIDAGSATDVLEMDAASNNGVENIRDIRDEVVYSPSSLKYRVYIVDEVHMLSPSAFNALLKTLEEPPAHVVFILATTELHKLPATIISRCQRFDFRRITVSDIMSRLLYIAQKENIQTENDALRIIAKYSQGGMRDAISLFELCTGNRSQLSSKDVTDTIGSISNETIAKILTAVRNKDYDVIFSVIDDIVSSSKDISIFWDDMITYCRSMLIYKTAKCPEAYLDLTESEKKQLGEVADMFTKDTVLYFIKLLNDSLVTMQKANSTKRYIAEMTLVRMGDESLDTSSEAILSRISKLEVQLSSAKLSVSTENEIKSNIKKEAHAQKQIDASPKTDTKQEKTDIKPTPTIKNDTAPATEKLFRGWREIVDKVALGDFMAGPFLKKTKAYILPSGKVSVRFQDSFAMDMFLKSSLLASLYSNIGEAIKKPVGEADVEFIVSTSTVNEDDDLENLIQ